MQDADPAEKPGKLQRAIEFFGLKRSMVGLLTMVILVGVGEKMSERFLPIYLLALSGLAFLPGLLNSMTNILGALYSYPGGYLSDRLGTKRALLVFNVIAMVGFAIVIIVPHWVAVFVGAVFFMSWTAVSLPASMDLVARVLPKNKRTMGVSMHSLVRRIPMALGPLIGGLLIDHYTRKYSALYGETIGHDMGVSTGVRVAFAGALGLALLAAVMQALLIEDDRHQPRAKAEMNPLKSFREMSPALRNLLTSDILIRFAEQLPYAYMAIWAMETAKGAGVSGFDFGVLTTIEMTVAILCYIPVAYLADKTHKKPFVLITFVFFTLFPLALWLSHTFWMLVIAFVIRGLKEMGEPTRKALIMDLAPEGKKASTFGVYYLARDLVVGIVAASAGVLWLISPAALFLTAFAMGVLGTAWFAIKGTDLPKA